MNALNLRRTAHIHTEPSSFADDDNTQRKNERNKKIGHTNRTDMRYSIHPKYAHMSVCIYITVLVYGGFCFLSDKQYRELNIINTW